MGSLPQGTTVEELRQLFAPYGDIAECDVVNRCGFLHLEDKTLAFKAIEELNNTTFKGTRISVEKGRVKPPNRDRAGGPRGGQRNGFGGGPMRGGRDNYRSGPYMRDGDFERRAGPPPPRGPPMTGGYGEEVGYSTGDGSYGGGANEGNGYDRFSRGGPPGGPSAMGRGGPSMGDGYSNGDRRNAYMEDRNPGYVTGGYGDNYGMGSSDYGTKNNFDQILY